MSSSARADAYRARHATCCSPHQPRLGAVAGSLRPWCGEELRFPDTRLCIEAAIAGMGVALVEARHVEKELHDRRLVAPLGFTAFSEGLAAVPTSDRAGLPVGKVFVEWLRDELS